MMFSTRLLLHFNIENMNTLLLRNKRVVSKYLYNITCSDQSSFRFYSGIVKNYNMSSHKFIVQKDIHYSIFSENKRMCEKPRINLMMNQSLSTTAVQHLFWERDPKGGYGNQIVKSRKELVQDGLKELREELVKWQDEVKEKFEADPIFVRPGDIDKIWNFSSPSSIDRWKVTSDSDHGEGFSNGSFMLSPTGHGLFHGDISTKVPKDGIVKKSGYCNIVSPKPRKSFKRDTYLDWQMYTHLKLRVRGDGRSYLVNINTSGYFDITWNDMYSYVLYTRGGPHWQETRIPFSKFFMSSKGRVQDKQCPVPLDRVVSLGISAGDRINAPFRLEIDHISLENDPIHYETFAYEMYKLPKYMIGP